MPTTLANLRTSLGSMIGYPTFADLPADEQTEIDNIINAAYLECYAEREGRRPRWIEQYVSDIVKAPAAATLGVTNGSKTVTGFAFESKYAGSFVKIGERFYRYGGTVSGVHSLVQPWDGDTGSVSATIYYNAVALPGEVIEICEGPSLLGIGPLSPLPSPEAEMGLRSLPAFDFTSRLGRAPFAYARPRFDQSLLIDVGDPIFFHIDQASTAATFTPASRLHLYPIPGATYTVELRADIVPTPLATGTDEPVFPGDSNAVVAGSVLLPIAFDLLVKHPLGRRYSGSNVELILANGEDARRKLRTTFARVQRRTRKSVGRAEGW